MLTGNPAHFSYKEYFNVLWKNLSMIRLATYNLKPTIKSREMVPFA
jgi:hypothetical protein